MRRIFRFASDLHLDYKTDITKHIKIKPLWENINQNNNNYLALLGDLGNSYDNTSINTLFRMVSDNYDKVYFVPGNHEYWSKNVPYCEIEENLEQLCNKYNIKMMNNKTDDIDDDYKIIGTTLWSNIPKDKCYYLKNKLPDYNRIKSSPYINITPEITNKWNKAAVKFIEDNIITNKKCIVLTHHSPMYPSMKRLTSHPKYISCKRKYGYHNNLRHLIKKPIVAWFYGHTHYNSLFYYNNVLVTCNQLGFLPETNDTFNANNGLDLDNM